MRPSTAPEDAVPEEHIPDYLRAKSPDEVRQILAKVRQGLEALYGGRLRALYLYGSYARGEARPGSDLDILAVLDQVESAWIEIERTSWLCADLSLDYGVTVSLLLRSEDDWRRGDTPLVLNVRKEGRAA